MITYKRYNVPDDKTTKLFTSPHYRHDFEWRKPKTVWGKESGLLNYEYSDRLSEWNYYGLKNAQELASTFCIIGSAEYYEWVLRYYYNDRKIKLEHIMAGYNQGNGYPYLIFGFNR